MIVFLAAALPVSAQARGKDRAQAELRIRANIVSVADSAARLPENTDTDKDGVSFNLSSPGLKKMSENQETRSLTPLESLALRPKENRSAVLQTRTIVLP